MAEKVDVIVVGAGLAGLCCAHDLAKAGLEVLVVERGDYPGAKNVSGGRLYLNPVRALIADWIQDAPFERTVVKERLTMMSEGASITAELASDRLRAQPAHSVTVLRSTFDRWLGDRAMERGAMIIPRQIVRELVMDQGRVIGIQADDEIHADVVVAADGILSFIAEKAGLRQRLEPKRYAVAVKEVIELPAQTIEDRFGVEPGQGAAQLFFGSITGGRLGGGFIYTNRESLSLGLVVGIEAMMSRNPAANSDGEGTELAALHEAFKARPEIAQVVSGGNLVEYSAHVIPEGGLAAVPQLTGDGILVVGDAAGLALNMAVTVRGMDMAIASGVFAAQAILSARQAKDFTRAGLSSYETKLRSSFVWQDLTTFQQMPHVLENPRMFMLYPQVACELFEQLMWVGDGPKPKLSGTAMGQARKLINLTTLRDAWGLMKV